MQIKSSCGKSYALPFCRRCKQQYAHMSWFQLDICDQCLQDEQQNRYNPKTSQTWLSIVEPEHRDIWRENAR